MNLVHLPLAETGAAKVSGAVGRAPARSTVRAMQIGQHLMAVGLTLIGAIRAVGTGTALPAIVITGLAIIAWHTVGAVLPGRRVVGQKTVVWWLVGLAGIWLAAVAVSAEFVWVAFLLWLLAGHLLPLFWGLVYSTVVFIAVTLTPILHHGTTSYANVFGPLIGGVFAFGISRGYLQLLRDAAERERLLTSLSAAQAEMAELQDELALVQRETGAITERTRISRDIHDTIAQDLSSIRLLAHAGAARTADVEAGRTLEQLETLAAGSLVDVRRIVAALAPAELEDNALAAALRRILERTSEESGLRAELHVEAHVPALPTQLDVALLRTAQSALANVRVHAHASLVTVSLSFADGVVRLTIADDGAGFDLTAYDQSAAGSFGSSSFGLRFMRARLAELGGSLYIESSPGAGTVVAVHLPLPAALPLPTAQETL